MKTNVWSRCTEMAASFAIVVAHFKRKISKQIIQLKMYYQANFPESKGFEEIKPEQK